MTTMQDVELAVAVRSQPGLVTATNDETMIATAPCFLVADGLGLPEVGLLASQAALKAFLPLIRSGEPARVRDVGEAYAAARDAVGQFAFSRGLGVGCTLAGVVLVEYDHEPHWLVLNIGNSRVYLHRGAELFRLTADHTVSADAPQPAVAHQHARVARLLGVGGSEVDTWLLPVEHGTRILVCSDGLTAQVSDEQLRATLTMGGRAESVAGELVRRSAETCMGDSVALVMVDVLSGGRAWHFGSDTSSRSISIADDTITATARGR